MIEVDEVPGIVKGWSPADGWTPQWRSWFEAADANRQWRIRRARLIEHTVREALLSLTLTERGVIEHYYYDGFSFHRIAGATGLTLERVQAIHRRSLAVLRETLAPFVAVTFRLTPASGQGCPICSAPWRRTAEELLDEKTSTMTWGEVTRRLERAVGWLAPTPQILIGHQKKHRTFEPTPVDDTISDNDIQMGGESCLPNHDCAASTP